MLPGLLCLEQNAAPERVRDFFHVLCGIDHDDRLFLHQHVVGQRHAEGLMSLLLQGFPELKDTQGPATGSTSYEVAAKPIKRVMDAATGFLNRFRLRGNAPQHRSGTSALWFAEDVSNQDEAPVALKFMRNHAALEAPATHTASRQLLISRVFTG